MTEEKSLAGQVALITGGGKGIGRAVAEAYATEGARVAVAGRTLSPLLEVVARCQELGVESISVELDVTDRGACDAAAAACEDRWGRLDVLVNNAGIAESSKFVSMDDALWHRTLDVDLTGAFYMTRAALPIMLRRGEGAVIAMASSAGRAGGPYLAAYTAAKHGLIGLMRSLSAEYASTGITFNSVCPAYVDTEMTERTIRNIMHRTGRSREAALSHLLTPQGRLVTPEEVAAVCLLLASGPGRGINGQAINVDGGLLQS